MSAVNPDDLERLDLVVGEDGRLSVSPDALERLRARRGDHLRVVVESVQSRSRRRLKGSVRPVGQGATWADFETASRAAVADVEAGLRGPDGSAG